MSDLKDEIKKQDIEDVKIDVSLKIISALCVGIILYIVYICFHGGFVIFTFLNPIIGPILLHLNHVVLIFSNLIRDLLG